MHVGTYPTSLGALSRTQTLNTNTNTISLDYNSALVYVLYYSLEACLVSCRHKREALPPR